MDADYNEKGPQKPPKDGFSGACRHEEAKSDTVNHRWPREDRIRWVEWRVAELTVELGKYTDERGRLLLDRKSPLGHKLPWGDKLADYAVWLFKERDGLSWHRIAYLFFPSATEASIETFESKVRRAYARVERSHPGSKFYKPKPFSKEDMLLLRAAMFGLG